MSPSGHFRWWIRAQLDHSTESCSRAGRLTPPFALLDLLHLGAVTLRKLLEELAGLLALQRGSAQPVPRVDEDVEVLDVVEVQPAGGVLDVDEVARAVREPHDR